MDLHLAVAMCGSTSGERGVWREDREERGERREDREERGERREDRG